MRNYEAMFILRPDLDKDRMEELFTQIKETITKNNAQVTSSNIWADRRKLTYPIKKYREGTYYLVNFNSDQQEISKISRDYKINENILRVMITKLSKDITYGAKRT